jgi:FkbM family methyltransferase
MFSEKKEIKDELLQYLIKTAGFKTIHEAEWKFMNGDHTLVFDHELTSASVVFEVGAYLGDFAIGLYKKHPCNIYVFEPVEQHYYDLIDNLYKNGIELHGYKIALSNRSEIADIYVSGDASSSHKTPLTFHIEKAEHVAIDELMDAHEINRVDLININIEGAEYDLIEYILDKDIVTKFVNIQVQFHEFVEGYQQRYEVICERLGKTHELTYRYPFVWENWELKQ